MRHNQGCMICGKELIYFDSEINTKCSICGQNFKTNVICEDKHYVCDNCHSKDALDVILDYCSKSTIKNPLELAMLLMKDSKINLHGPEHHFLVPAALITVYSNLFEDEDLKLKRLKIAKDRASSVPGGLCGFYGSCGAGIGCGIFASVISEATPLTSDSWGFSNRMTGFVLYSLGEIGGPRCCKRNTWYSIIKASEFLYKEKGQKLFDFENARPVCTYKNKNKECIKINCPFFLNK